MAWNSLAEPSGWYSLCQILTLNVLAWSRGQNYGLSLDLEAKILVSSGLEDRILVLVWVSVWVSGLIWVSVQVWVSGGWSGSQSGSQEFGLDLLCSVLFNITESGVFVCAFSHWAVVDFSLCKSTHSFTVCSEALQCIVTVPLEIPQNFTVVNGSVNATHAVFTWFEVDTSFSRIRGFFRGYQVCNDAGVVKWKLC